MNPNDNAFPTTGNGPTDGLTKREWFAGMAMPLVYKSNMEIASKTPMPKFEKDPALFTGRMAVQLADGLIIALSEEEKP